MRATQTLSLFSADHHVMQMFHVQQELRDMANGKVKWFNEVKGYGFLTTDDGNDVFVHYSSIVGEGFRTLNEGDEVEFQISETPKGPQAMDVRKKTE